MTGLRESGRVGQGRRARQRQGSPRLDRTADLAAGRRPARAESRARRHLKWDLWLGPAPVRPYGNGYHPFAWRGWWDFGTGALGDMACHTMNMPFMAPGPARSDLGRRPKPPATTRTAIPKWSIITYRIRRHGRPAGREAGLVRRRQAARPRNCSTARSPASSGCAHHRREGQALLAQRLRGGVLAARRRRGRRGRVRRSRPATSRNGSARSRAASRPCPTSPTTPGRLTETILLGQPGRLGPARKVEWDAKNMKSTNVSGLEEIVKPVYREGLHVGRVVRDVPIFAARRTLCCRQTPPPRKWDCLRLPSQ